MLESYRGPCGAAVVVEREKHLAICLKEFRDTIESVSQIIGGFNCPHNSLGLMACIVQLIYFELFAGNDTWKIHLKAVCTAFGRGYYNEIDELGLIKGRDAIWDPDTELRMGCQPNEQKAIFRFMSGVVIWLDVLSSVTMGTTPDTLEYHPHALSSSSHIKLENIMGCHNWVVMQIARIAALHSQKFLQDNCPNAVDLTPQIEDIRAELQRGLTELCLASMAIDQQDPARIFPVSKPPSFITRIFAISAGIYLHLVVHGYESGSEILKLMATEAMMILRNQVPAEMMHTIIFPLYIVGSLATGDDQAFFRYVFSAMPVLDPSLEHRSKILPLLEKVWHRRQSSSTLLTWQETLSFSDQSLLLI